MLGGLWLLWAPNEGGAVVNPVAGAGARGTDVAGGTRLQSALGHGWMRRERLKRTRMGSVVGGIEKD